MGCTTDIDLGERRLLEMMRKLDGATVEAGLFEGDKAADGALGVAAIGAANEFGVPTKNVPARPWLSRACDELGQQWMARGEAALDRASTTGADFFAVLLGMGEIVASGIRRTIDAVLQPPKAASTLRKDPSKTHPLIDTSTMKNSVRSRIAFGGKKQMTSKAGK
jgi:hypothetical protein